ncbi:MAG: hypothetical protein IJE49_08725 [Agathobacter sp.]|nr:hypothetical protein [Agathobacter sp.]
MKGSEFMLGIKKKTVLIIIVVTVAVFAILYGGIYFLTNAGDKNIRKYDEILRATLDENIHFMLEDIVPHRSTEIAHQIEHYKYDHNKLRISKYPLEEEYRESHWFVYEGKDYTYRVRGEDIEVNMSNYVMPTDKIPDGIDASYYTIIGANVTYEETDSHYIFTYDNKLRKNMEVWDDYYEEVVGGYTSGVSVAYLDKEWNLEKLVITEKWNILDENGEEIERERTFTLTYYDTTEEEIKKALEDEYDMMMTELYGPEYEENN